MTTATKPMQYRMAGKTKRADELSVLKARIQYMLSRLSDEDCAEVICALKKSGIYPSEILTTGNKSV